MTISQVDPNFISMGYDFDASLNHQEGEMGAFHCGYFNDLGDDYPLAMKELVGKVGDPLKKASCRKVLDVGCGLGYPLSQVASTLKGEFFGVDLSQRSITLAEDIHLEEIEKGTLNFRQMDGHHLLFRDDSFDGLFSIECLFHMDKLKAVREMYRVLQPGGIISVSDYYAKEGWKELIRRGHSANIPLEDFVEIFRVSGFKNVQFIDLTDKVKPTFEYFKKRKMSPQIQKYWLDFCENAHKIAGYVHITAEK